MAFPPVPFQEWFLRQTSTGNAALNAYVARVKADGGVVEAIGCVPLAVWDWVAPVAPSFVGLLDLYPNAAAAYSLRKLRAAYSGSAVRVRKEVSSVSSETDIGFAADGSLDTVSLLAFASDADSGDVFVVTWYDQSLSNDATQSTAADQPKIVSGGSLVTENGKPAVDFDGVDDYFVFTTPTTLSGEFFVTTALNCDPVGTGSTLLNNQTGFNDRLRLYSTGNIEIRNSSSLYNYTLSFTPNTQSLLTIQRDSVDSIEIYVNSSSKGANTDGNDWTDILGYLGSNQNQNANLFYNGNIQEFIAYNLDESANRTAIETNINTFYSIY